MSALPRRRSAIELQGQITGERTHRRPEPAYHRGGCGRDPAGIALPPSPTASAPRVEHGNRASEARWQIRCCGASTHGRGRTDNLHVRSVVLYPLSYVGKSTGLCSPATPRHGRSLRERPPVSRDSNPGLSSRAADRIRTGDLHLDGVAWTTKLHYSSENFLAGEPRGERPCVTVSPPASVRPEGNDPSAFRVRAGCSAN